MPETRPHRIDPAWLSLLLGIPGLLLALLDIFLYTEIIYSRPGETLGYRLFFANLLLLPLHLILLIPTWLVLIKSQNKILATRIKLFLDFLTIFVVLPVLSVLIRTRGFGAYGGILGGYFPLIVAIAVVTSILALGWVLIWRQFRGNGKAAKRYQ